MSSPSSSVQEARKALGQRLAEIRQGAGLTERALAQSLGWHESRLRVSRAALALINLGLTRTSGTWTVNPATT
ncbi:hypothetical protein ACWEKM_38085 [Streptomyces sp. NPDC004752]